MLTRFVRSFTLVALAATPAIVTAQKKQAPTIVRLTPYVGYMAFGSIASGPLGSQLTNAGAPLYGLQLGIDVTPNVALVGNLGYSDSNIEVGLPIIGGLKVADSKAVLYDGGLQLRLPTLSSMGTGIVPYVEAGAGAIHYEVRGGPVTTRSTNLAVNYGGGLDLQMTRALGLRVMVKDYVGKFDFKEATGLSLNGNTAHNWLFGAGLNLGF
jgi:outer membrane protein with beta-barrel domain